MILIQGCKVWTGVPGQPAATRDILIEGEVIAEVGEPGALAPGDQDFKVIHASGKTAIPGLIDAHVHVSLDGRSADPVHEMLRDGPYVVLLKAAGFAREYIRAGITTVRDMGGFEGIDLALKKCVSGGLVPGPRLLVSGKVLCMTGGHGYFFGLEVDGPDEVRKGARTQLKAGADVVKVMATGGVLTPGVEPGSPQLSYEEIRAAVEEAHRAGRRAASHAQGTQGIKDSIRAGVDTVEHGIFLDDEAITMMLDSGVFLIPTLVAPQRIVEGGREAGIPEFAVRKARDVWPRHLESVAKAYQAGVKIAAGTDAGTPLNPHGSLVKELELLTRIGMSREEALAAATRVAAEALGIDAQVGTLEKGKIADVVLLDGDPLADLSNLERVVCVIQRGQVVYG
jgi:imidazolonepropionase-like amidohydrolase